MSAQINPARKSGFTLIELLVVIAIIAILAAILFPVFANAREKARSIACLSNCKQIGLAFVEYTQDYDEMPPCYDKTPVTTGGLDGTGYAKTWYVLLQPYLSSWNVLLCPDRIQSFSATTNANDSNSTDPYGCFDNINPTGECLGYGFNDGWISDQGYALLAEQTEDTAANHIRPGINIAGISSPSQLVAIADTNDNGSYSCAADNDGSQLPSGNPGGTFATKLLRHMQTENCVFCDGHAKPIKVVSATWNGTNDNGADLVVPANHDLALDWCADPDPNSSYIPQRTADNPALSKYPLSANENCYNAVQDVYANSTVNN